MTKPLLFCPAMNTAMWEHPITAQQVEQLKDFGYMEIPCVVKRLVCGDEGQSLAWPLATFLCAFSHDDHGNVTLTVRQSSHPVNFSVLG